MKLLRFAKELQNAGISDCYINEAIHCIRRDNFVELLKLKFALLIMQRFNLNAKLIREVNKSIFIDLLDYFLMNGGDLITQYYIVSDNALGHWAMYVRVQVSSDKSIVVKAHLLCCAGKHISHLRHTIRARNGGKFDEATEYIYPDLLLNADFNQTMQNCRVQWNDIAVTMDDEAFKPYGQLTNNCQQWVERVCMRLELDHRSPLINDAQARSYRQTESTTPETTKSVCIIL